MKIILSFIFIIFLAGCDSEMRGKRVSDPSDGYPTTCIDGVVYFLFRELGVRRGYGYMSPKFNRDGTVATCNESQPVRQ